MRCRMLRKVCFLDASCQTCVAIETPRLWKNTSIRKKLLDVFAAYFATPYAVHLLEEQKELKGAHGVSEESFGEGRGEPFRRGKGHVQESPP